MFDKEYVLDEADLLFHDCQRFYGVRNDFTAALLLKYPELKKLVRMVENGFRVNETVTVERDDYFNRIFRFKYDIDFMQVDKRLDLEDCEYV